MQTISVFELCDINRKLDRHYEAKQAKVEAEMEKILEETSWIGLPQAAVDYMTMKAEGADKITSMGKKAQRFNLLWSTLTLLNTIRGKLSDEADANWPKIKRMDVLGFEYGRDGNGECILEEVQAPRNPDFIGLYRVKKEYEDIVRFHKRDIPKELQTQWIRKMLSIRWRDDRNSKAHARVEEVVQLMNLRNARVVKDSARRMVKKVDDEEEWLQVHVQVEFAVGHSKRYYQDHNEEDDNEATVKAKVLP